MSLDRSNVPDAEVHSTGEELDLGSATVDSGPAYRTVRYDPARARESVRGWIALSLIALLALIIGASFVFMWLHPDKEKSLHDLLALILGPMIALVGSATGFYFGSQERIG